MSFTSTKRQSPEVGDPAPDATLIDMAGNKVILSSFWAQRPVALVFLRHFGCPFCREQVAMLRRDYARFVEAGLDILCIGQGPHKAGKAFAVYFDLPFPVVVCEDDLSVYGRFGLDKASIKQMLGIHVWLRGLAAMKHGFGPARGEATQLPGTFIIDTSGTVVFAHRALDQADNVTSDQLLNAFNLARTLAGKEMTS